MNDVIIFSSKEQLELANAIQIEFYKYNVSGKTWHNDFFKPSTYTMESFEESLKNYRKAIVILGEDDFIESREQMYKGPRDNVVLELGICIGTLGIKNTFFVYSDKTKIPSDLLGITAVPITETGDVNITASVIVGQLLKFIKDENSSLKIKKMIMWEEYVSLVNKLLLSLKQSVNFGGYYFDVILSVSRGGSVLAGVLARTYGQNIPVLYLQEDRRDGNGAYDTLEVNDINQGIIRNIEARKYKNILIVDSAVRTGVTLQRAREFLSNELKGNVIVKTAVLLVDKKIDETISVDYYAEKTDIKGTAFFYNQFG